MLFNSLTFLFFLFFVVTLYWNTNDFYRRLLLLFSSLIFYGFWRIDFIPLIFFSLSVDYFAGLLLSRENNERRRKWILITSISINLLTLGFFKYLLFFVDNLNGVLTFFDIETISLTWKIILPIGISFYTFQSISYTVDVYRKTKKAETDFLLFSNYVLFFPQLVAGPILRASEVIEQLKHRPKSFKLVYLHLGIKYILTGLFLKVVLADNIGSLVNSGFNIPGSILTPLDVFTIAILFGLQIYFDFSGYSYVAIGAAKLMGIHFPRNFYFPYSSINPKEFWKRWHISLSSWIRDYLYLPLCNITVKKSASTGGLSEQHEQRSQNKIFALFITWILMGFWHGAAWGFVIWGIWHAILVIINRLIFSKVNYEKMSVKIFSWAFFMPLIVIGWIPFRAQSIDKTTELISALFNFSNQFVTTNGNITLITSLTNAHYLVAFFIFSSVIIVGYLHTLMNKFQIKSTFLHLITVIKYSIMFLLTFIFLRPLDQFIYFQF